MIEQPGETNCIHGIGHKADLHGCDGCCAVAEKEDTDHKDEMAGYWFVLVFSLIFLVGIAYWYSTPPMELVETQFPMPIEKVIK